MPAAKTKAAKDAVDAALTPTDAAAQDAVYASTDLLATLGVDGSIPTALDDATAVLAHVRRVPWTTHAALVAWANSAFLENPVDRLNAAVSLLTQASLIGRLGG